MLLPEEVKALQTFLKTPIPEYVYKHTEEGFDLLECYEIGFEFARLLMKGQTVNPNVSPWGDGDSVIFNSRYKEVLLRIIDRKASKDVENYCRIFLAVLDIFRLHFQ